MIRASAKAAIHSKRAEAHTKAAEKKEGQRELCAACAAKLQLPEPGTKGPLQEEGEALYKKALHKEVEAEAAHKCAEELTKRAGEHWDKADGYMQQARAEQESGAQKQRELEEQGQKLAQQQADTDRSLRALGVGTELEAAAKEAGQPLAQYLAARLEGLAAGEKELAQKQVEMAAQRSALDLAQQQVQRQQEEVAKEQQRQAEQGQHVAAALAAVQAQREALDRDRAALDKERDQVAALKAEYQGKLAGLEARDQATGAREKQVEGREQRAGQRELAVTEQEQGLAARAQALGGLEAGVSGREQAVLLKEKEVAVTAVRLRKMANERILVAWDGPIYGLDDAIESLNQIGVYVTLLCAQSHGYLERDGGMQDGEIMDVRNAYRR